MRFGGGGAALRGGQAFEPLVAFLSAAWWRAWLDGCRCGQVCSLFGRWASSDCAFVFAVFEDWHCDYSPAVTSALAMRCGMHLRRHCIPWLLL